MRDQKGQGQEELSPGCSYCFFPSPHREMRTKRVSEQGKTKGHRVAATACGGCWQKGEGTKDAVS